MMDMATVQGQRPLDGIRVVDFTHMRAGPQCTMMLGDMGAEEVLASLARTEGRRRTDA